MRSSIRGYMVCATKYTAKERISRSVIIAHFYRSILMQYRFPGLKHQSSLTYEPNRGRSLPSPVQRVRLPFPFPSIVLMNRMCMCADLQMVNITVRVLSRPNENNLATIYRELCTDFDERVLPSIVNEVLKGVTAQFNASQLISRLNCRSSVSS